MNKFSSIIFLLIILFMNCGSPTEPTSNPGEYFPLKIGNKWYYNSEYPDTTSINIIWEVIGQEEITWKHYYAIVEQNLQTNRLDTLFFRFNGDTLFRRGTNREQIIADFSLNVNDTAYWQNDLRVVQKTQDIMIFETPFGADYGYSISFQKGIGIINLVQNGFLYYRRTLVKAEIK